MVDLTPGIAVVYKRLKLLNHTLAIFESSSTFRWSRSFGSDFIPEERQIMIAMFGVLRQIFKYYNAIEVVYDITKDTLEVIGKREMSLKEFDWFTTGRIYNWYSEELPSYLPSIQKEPYSVSSAAKQIVTQEFNTGFNTDFWQQGYMWKLMGLLLGVPTAIVTLEDNEADENYDQVYSPAEAFIDFAPLNSVVRSSKTLHFRNRQNLLPRSSLDFVTTWRFDDTPATPPEEVVEPP